MNHTSLLRRQDWIEKRTLKIRDWAPCERETDFEILRRQEKSILVLIIFALGFAVRPGIEFLLDAEALFSLKFWIGCVISVGFFYLLYLFLRFRWALKAFEEFAPQYLHELKTRIAEQAGAGQPATRPVVESEGSDKPQPETEGRCP